MADRFFPNEMPDFVEESSDQSGSGDSLLSLLASPYPAASQRFLRSALDLKDKIVRETWRGGGRRVKDFTLYTGSLGTAFLLFKAYQGAIAKEMILDGKRLANKGSCPLMYEWHGKKYWGAAHGLAGILHVLMDMNLKAEDLESVKGILRYMIQNRFPSGNYPSSEGSTLIISCIGVMGLLVSLSPSPKLLRAKAFACFLIDKADGLIAEGKMHGRDHPFSLFEGQGGMAYLLLDMVNPSEARFPAYEI
ncbi:hypothetical protein QJS10_CPB21g00558 [Acorus calamus]|uniref:LanC-like protein n=1 Tax=Acorus calamus TaxID=4465 RepID=A0AAV9C593_ACOCL|nr:hypothetical protein QJS10_CPB21g00558 [Acorus calamus]